MSVAGENLRAVLLAETKPDVFLGDKVKSPSLSVVAKGDLYFP